LSCSICLGILKDAVTINNDASDPCGHFFCQSCLKEHLLKSSSCPQCRKPSCVNQIIPDMGSRVRVWSLRVKCPFHVSGCPWQGEQGRQCATVLGHVRSCAFDTVKCDYCQTTVPRAEAKQHDDTCDQKPVDCPYKLVGCDRKVGQGETQAHLRDETQRVFHEALMFKALMLTKTENQDLSKKLTHTEAELAALKQTVNTLAQTVHSLQDELRNGREEKKNPVRPTSTVTSIDDAESKGVCTFNFTQRRYMSQIGICLSCAKKCHAGHRLGQPIRRPAFFCDCGAGDVKCKALGSSSLEAALAKTSCTFQATQKTYPKQEYVFHRSLVVLKFG